MSNTKSFTEIKEIVEKWWHNLQFERKCNSTNLVQKVVSKSSPETQEKVRQVIVQLIENLLEKCLVCKDLNHLQRACNAINGCFDNFVHAVDALRLLFPEVLSFIDFGLSECLGIQLNVRTNQKNAVLELLHSLSRILILVLKLGRTQNLGKAKGNRQRKDSGDDDLQKKESCKSLLSGLTHKISKFLLMNDILIDTKNNLSMAGILVRELLAPDENALVEFHRNFIKTIPASLSDEQFKVNILKFLMSSAIINSWSVNIIDSDSIQIYLKFFICLCEKYSSETPIVLNTSRTLLLLIKHDSFKAFVSRASQEEVQASVSALLSCIFMLLEHPVPCVRHSAKDFLQLLAVHPSLHPIMVKAVFKLPTEKRSYFISVGALAKEIGTEALTKNNADLPKQLIAALCDPTIVSHVSLALEFVILRDGLAQKDFAKWNETWIVPLLISLMSVLPIVAADIEKLLEKAFKKYPESVVYVIDKWANPTAGEELRYVVTALKISQKQGFKLKGNDCSDKTGEDEDAEKELMSEKLLEQCLHQRDDDIRVSAFSLLVEAHKSTKAFSERDFRMILYFLKYNLNNQQPSTRQKILGLIRKMLVRFSESKATLLKPSKSEAEQKRKLRSRSSYDQFLDSLTSFCFSNIFVGCNFNRLNSVLNILLLCFENVKDMSFNRDKTDFYWSKFLIALDSSYEENKALAVVLAHKLDLSLLEANMPSAAKSLYEKAFSLCTHMEPPDVLTGSYLLQVLVKLPSSQQVLRAYFVDDCVVDDVCYCCIRVLLQRLKEQIRVARLDLMTAATCGPMYGALFAIRLIFKSVSLSGDLGRSALVEWGRILNEIVEASFEMTRTVGCVVNSSSPEGHLPMDFQKDFESLLSRSLSEKCHLKGAGEYVHPQGRDSGRQLVRTICSSFLKKFEELLPRVEGADCDAYESLRSVNCLLKENELLIREVEALGEGQGAGNGEERELLRQLEDVRVRLQRLAESLERVTAITEWPATAQVLLLCAWRSIKEASLYLGDLVSKLPIETEIELGLVSKGTVVRIGEELRLLLCEIKHRGAFEQAYIGFTQLVNSLWKCADKNLSDLPRQWLEDITTQLEAPLSDQKVKLCSTRRSAGLPFLVQAIISSEIVSIKSTTPSSLHDTMKFLLRITEDGVEENPEAKIHALNVLRALFKHAQLGEHVACYVSRALTVAIRGSRAETWSERNSSSLLFSSLIIRVFGVSRSREEISKKNRMTSRTFFQRYSELYDFLLSEMELVYSTEHHADGLQPKPSLYLVLLVLGRLYPPPTEDPDNIDLSEFLPYINKSRKNPTMKIRELGARALVPLIPLDRLLDELDDRFLELSSSAIGNNERHGILLQVKELLSQSPEAFESLSKGGSGEREARWVENTKWMLACPQMPLIVLSSYVRVVHVLFKRFPSSRGRVSELIKGASVSQKLLRLSSAQQSLLPGIHLFLENFYFLKTDVLARDCLLTDSTRRRGDFLAFFMSMLKCEVSEVQSIPLRVLRHFLRSDCLLDVDDDDFSGITVPVTDLLLFDSKENLRNVRSEILSSEVLTYLTEQVNARSDEVFTSTLIQRLWLSVVSTLVLSGAVPISHSHVPDSSLRIDFAKPLIRSGDKALSTSALTCYALYLMEELSTNTAPPEDRLLLSDVLHEFSRSDADVRERLAVARIMNRCCDAFLLERTAADPVVLGVWMIPFRLLADEDPEVRAAAAELVRKLQAHVASRVPSEKVLVEMKTLDWPHLPLVPLKAQECLLDCYLNILGRENLIHLLAQMVIMAVSCLCDLGEPESSKDEFGVFEKGNPNPFCEELALSEVVCGKVRWLREVGELDRLLREDVSGAVGGYPKEYLYYERVLKRKCLRKLRANVWERKTKWVLVARAEEYWRTRVLARHLSAWVEYLNGCYRKKMSRRAAEVFREERLLRKGLRALRRNAEEARVLMRLHGKRFEWGLKRKCWHLWRHYAEKRVKVREVKALADRIREERLRKRWVCVWWIRWREKRWLEEAWGRAEARLGMRLKGKYFGLWRMFRERRAWKVRIGEMAVRCYEEKLKERVIGWWRRYAWQRKRYRYQVRVIQDFYERYLLRNYLSRWAIAHERRRLARKVAKRKVAVEWERRKLLRRGLGALWEARERRRGREERAERFREVQVRVVVGFYLGVWVERRREKAVSEELERRAREWRERYLREAVVRELWGRYQERVEEREEMGRVVRWAEGVVVRRALRAWAGVAERRGRRRAQREEAVRVYLGRLRRRAFEGWKAWRARRWRKRMAVEYYRSGVLSRAVGEWRAFVAGQKEKRAEARKLRQRLDGRLVRKAFEWWRSEVKSTNSKLSIAVAFHEKSRLSRALRWWQKVARAKAAHRSRYNRNRAILEGIVVKDAILRWYEMHSVKLSLGRRLEGLRQRRDRRALRWCFGRWQRFAQKMKAVQLSARTYPQVREGVVIEEYLGLLVEAVESRRALRGKQELARRAGEQMLKRRYWRRWLEFICWRRERMLRCLAEERRVEAVVPVGRGVRRQPVIPEFLRSGFDPFEGCVNEETFRVMHPVNRKLPVVDSDQNDSFGYSDAGWEQ